RVPRFAQHREDFGEINLLGRFAVVIPEGLLDLFTLCEKGVAERADLPDAIRCGRHADRCAAALLQVVNAVNLGYDHAVDMVCHKLSGAPPTSAAHSRRTPRRSAAPH